MKTVLVTGGTRGIGLSTAKKFIDQGWNVYITSRKEENLSKAASEIKDQTGKTLHWKMMDVRNNETVEEVAKHIKDGWGYLDVLINNAAGNFVTPTAAMSENAWRAVIDIVLDGTFRVSKACYPLLRNNKEGSSHSLKEPEYSNVLTFFLLRLPVLTTEFINLTINKGDLG